MQVDSVVRGTGVNFGDSSPHSPFVEVVRWVIFWDCLPGSSARPRRWRSGGRQGNSLRCRRRSAPRFGRDRGTRVPTGPRGTPISIPSSTLPRSAPLTRKAGPVSRRLRCWLLPTLLNTFGFRVRLFVVWNWRAMDSFPLLAYRPPASHPLRVFWPATLEGFPVPELVPCHRQAVGEELPSLFVLPAGELEPLIAAADQRAIADRASTDASVVVRPWTQVVSPGYHEADIGEALTRIVLEGACTCLRPVAGLLAPNGHMEHGVVDTSLRHCTLLSGPQTAMLKLSNKLLWESAEDFWMFDHHFFHEEPAAPVVPSVELDSSAVSVLLSVATIDVRIVRHVERSRRVREAEVHVEVRVNGPTGLVQNDAPLPPRTARDARDVLQVGFQLFIGERPSNGVDDHLPRPSRVRWITRSIVRMGHHGQRCGDLLSLQVAPHPPS